MRYFLSLLFSLYLCLPNLMAQTAIQFTSDEGLSNSLVRRIYEDSRHNVWICTRNGLNRYDGSKINVYHHDPANPLSLGNDIVTYILEMDADHLIVSHESGLQSYDYATNTFTNIPMITESGDTLHTHTIGLYQFINGDVHICATAPGSYVIKKKNNGELYAQYTSDYAYGDHRPNILLNSKEGEVWSINDSGQVVHYVGKKATMIDGINNAFRMAKGSDGNIYIATLANELMRYDSTTQHFVKLSAEGLPDNVVIKSLRSDGNGTLMISTDGNGLQLYNEKTGKVRQSAVRGVGFNLDKSNVEDAMLDCNGNLWVGVYWKGVVVMPKAPSTFDYIGHRSPLKNTIGPNCVTSILPSRNGGIWVAADHSGLYRVSDDGTESKHWQPGSGVPETIGSLFEDANGRLWMGSSIAGMSFMDPSSGTVTQLTDVCPEAKDVRLIFDIAEDEHGSLWIGTMGNGVFRYTPSTHQLLNFTRTPSSAPSNISIIPIPWISCVEVHRNHLYVGSAAGLFSYTIKADGTLAENSSMLQTMVVNDIKIADDGTVWAATSGGVQVIDPKGNITALTVADGLSDNHVCSIELEQNADGIVVWAATDHGLCRIDTKHTTDGKPNINQFFVSDGLQGNEFIFGVSAQRAGVLYFGGINGINYFDPKKIGEGREAKNTDFRIVGFYVFGQQVNAGDLSGSYTVMDRWIAEANEINLCHSDNTFSLELASLNLIGGNASYEYSINGDEWVSLGEGQNRITFTNMPAGKYHVRIRTVGYNQQTQERDITIHVHPAWYASTWAYVIYLLLILLAAYFIYQQIKERVAARKVLIRHRQEEELNEARIQFFMNISHEIRTPMTLILAPLEKLKAMDSDAEHQHNYKLIHQNAHRILRLINQLMDVRKIEKGQFELHYRRSDIVELIQNLYDVYESTAKNRKIDFRFIHSGIERLEAMVDPSAFDKVVMNLLSNAFKFTPDEGNITITLSNEDEGLFQLRVTDSGVGIADSEKTKVFKRFYSSKHQNGYIGTGIGLNLTALLVNLHQGEIQVEDNPVGQGSQFVVNMPVEVADQAAVITETADDTVIEAEMNNMLSHEELHEDEIGEQKSTTIRHRNLLVVEDDSAIRQYIHSELASDFVIHECSNGMEGWEYVQHNPEKVDLIISDIMMPVMEGTTLCQKVKSNFTTNDIPVILMSAKTTEADRIAGISIGADAYVTKPFNVELLRTTALNIIKQRQMLKGKFVTASQHVNKIEQIEITSPDEHLMERVMKVINTNMDNPELSVEFVADKVGVSRVHFHRKIKELTGQTPRDFIKSIRLKEAARLLSEKRLDITDVSIATGFKSLSTFSTSFKQVYGQTPSEYMKERLNNDE